MKLLQPPSKLYSEYIFNGNNVALEFWGPIPRNLEEAITISKPLIKTYQKKNQPLFTPQRFDKLIRTIKKIHQSYKKLTPKVRESLTNLEEHCAVVEAGHQPALLGGPGFVMNKLAAISQLATFQQTTPIMFVGDHDHEQKELTVIHLPSPGPRGLTFSFPVPHEYRQSPLHVLPLPPQAWLTQTLQKITSTYHELVAGASQAQKKVYQKRIQDLIQILDTTYNQASTLTEWTLYLWMNIINQSQDSGILFQTFSDASIRHLMLPAFEYLLATRNRHKLIAAVNDRARQLRQLGYQPGIGIRTKTYVPFHLECPTKGCHRTRLDPTLTKHSTKSIIEITAQCPKCKTSHSLETKSTNPDLGVWKNFLSPRVDTRAFLVQSYTPVILHIGGAGETTYHAQVSPALKAVKSIAPIFFRYTRLYYGNPWTHNLGKKLTQEKLITLKMSKLQSYASAIKTAYNEKNSGVIQTLFAATEGYIFRTAEQLIQDETNLEKERTDAITQQREATEPQQKKQIQSKVGVLTRRRKVLQTYLSQMFGRYSPERLGQEVSFAWIDAAISLGPKELFVRLLDHYRLLTPSSTTFYLANHPLTK